MVSNYKTPLKSTDFGCPEEEFSLCGRILESHTNFLMKVISFYQNKKIASQYLSVTLSTMPLNIENVLSTTFNYLILLDILFSQIPLIV